MRPTLQRGVRTLSWTRVVPRVHRQARCVQIRATPSEEPAVNGAYLPLANTPASAESRGMSNQRGELNCSDLLMTLRFVDARFDVVGAPYSLLSVSLSASQNLYTRRGTLVGLSGKADNVCIPMCLLPMVTRGLTLQ